MFIIVIIYIKTLIISYNCIDIMTKIYYNIIVARDKLHKLLLKQQANPAGGITWKQSQSTETNF